MIKGFEEFTYELTDIELLIIDDLIKGLGARIGKENAITSTKICNRLNLNAGRLRKMINYIRITNQLPGLCSSKKGYFVAKDIKEIEDYMISLKQRIKSQVDVLNSLENQSVLWGGSGQLSLFE
tara:strand:+ start:1124 stop:1495 length:372 start_codon:yes stop_codon:yes gene_type:complete